MKLPKLPNIRNLAKLRKSPEELLKSSGVGWTEKDAVKVTIEYGNGKVHEMLFPKVQLIHAPMVSGWRGYMYQVIPRTEPIVWEKSKQLGKDGKDGKKGGEDSREKGNKQKTNK